jgi:hypothetical protein
MNRRRFIRTASLLPAALALRGSFSSFAQSRISASMWIYLWDFADEGYENVFRRLRENGLTAVSLASAYHAGKFLLPHNPKRKVLFLEDGTVYFQPTSTLYGRIKPKVNSLVAQGDSLATVRKHADRAGMQTNTWVVCCHNTPLGTEYPDIACVNAFGDSIPQNLCPVNSDVRSYLRAIVRDIAGHGVGRIELEAMQFQGYAHGFHHEREGIPLSAAMRFLLGLCFCPSCIKRAKAESVDISGVRTFTRETLEALFLQPSKVNEQYATLTDLPEDRFKPFLEWRMRVVSSLAGELMESVKGTNVQLRPLVSIDPIGRTMVGIDPERIVKTTGGILVPGYVKDGTALRNPLKNIQAAIGKAELILGFQVGLPESGGRPEFLDRLTTARELGVTSFNFYNYGFVPYEHLGWIKEGLGEG